ncbi:hypothetical protein E4T56_gene9178 [Termitomyces sp. T112]|nr:hypothetical protein E4T56_gene9178 [Termitomyces sp. T112]
MVALHQAFADNHFNLQDPLRAIDSMGTSLSILLPKKKGSNSPTTRQAVGDKDQSPRSRNYDERANQFWTLYVNEAEQDDKYLTETWKSDMDSTLIFAGLFSAAVTAFLIDSYKLLQVSSSDVTNNLLEQMLAVQIVGASLNTSAIPLPTAVPTPSFKPSASAVIINVLWFLSLSCSLAAALCATLVQQWTRDYLQRIHQSNQPQRRGKIRGIMFHGTIKWRMNDVVDNIPSLLHLSLFSFFAGLCIFLYTIDNIPAGVVSVVVAGCLVFYMFATIAPVWDPSAPYETPFSTLLWKIKQSLVVILGAVRQPGTAKPKDLAEAREALALQPANGLSVHKHIQAVSWLYDRTTDDSELEKLVAAIPGFLKTHDGRKAWDMLVTDKPETANGVRVRILELFWTCRNSAHDYLDQKSQKRRAMLCMDAILAVLSLPQSHNTSFTSKYHINRLFYSSLIEDDVLAMHFFCLDATFIFYKMRKQLQLDNSDEIGFFRDLSIKADQTLRDLDDMQHILDNFLQDYDVSCETQKADIMLLVKAYFDVAKSKALVLGDWSGQMTNIASAIEYGFLPWYNKLRFETSPTKDYHIPSLPENQFFLFKALEILGYLRLHKVFPPLPEISYTLHENVKGLSEAWVVTDDACPTRDEGGFPARETGIHMPIVHHQGTFPQYLSQELHPISSLLGLLDIAEVPSPITSPVVPINDHMSCNWMLLATRDEGPFSLLASFYEASVEDKGTIGGLLILLTTLRRYKPRVFDSSIVDRWLKVICPNLERWGQPLNNGSQILLVITLLEILTWKRDTPFEVCFPISDNVIRKLIRILKYRIDNVLPITMAERGLGIIPDSGSSEHGRVMSIWMRMVQLFEEANVSHLFLPTI